MARINLGDAAKDSMTGFEGIVVCESQWLHGCRRLTLQPQALHDGKPVESQTFDEPQVVRVEASVFQPTVNTGGPRPEPLRQGLPR